jgi:hypothetical protein
MPFVTNHKYKIHWAETGIDFESMDIEQSERWRPEDKNIYLVHNYSDVRALMDVNVGSQFFENHTLPNYDISNADYKTGMNILKDDPKEFHLAINGKNNTRDNQKIRLKAHRCDGSCTAAIVVAPMENRTRYWNNSADWPNGTIPIAGDTVEVMSGWNMVFDLEESPILKMLTINGILTFKNDSQTQIHLRAKHIFIRAGELHIGSAEYPFLGKARITLHGEKETEAMVYDNAIEAGNKLIANVGLMSIYGTPRKQMITRLHAEAKKGDNKITVEPNLDLVPGDRLGLTATSFKSLASDDVFVTSYDNVTGVVTLTSSLNHYHWGAPISTSEYYSAGSGVDIRGEVMILSRNIVIAGENVQSWGGQIVTSDTIEGDMTFR